MFTRQELSTIIAALRYYQDGVAKNCVPTMQCYEIATNGGEFRKLTSNEVEILCTKVRDAKNSPETSAELAIPIPKPPLVARPSTQP